MEATTRDLRLHTRELLLATERGEQVIITHRGKPRAKLVPFQDQQSRSAEIRNPAFGIWADRDDMPSVDEQLRELRHPRWS